MCPTKRFAHLRRNCLTPLRALASAYLPTVSITKRAASAPEYCCCPVKWNFSPNRRWLGYNVGSPFLYRAIGVIFRLCGT
jgi:hypothetical protein